METLSDYFYLSSLNTPADYMAFGALIMLIVWFVSIFYYPLRIKEKSVYYFYLALILFSLAVLNGWNDLDVIFKSFWESL